MEIQDTAVTHPFSFSIPPPLQLGPEGIGHEEEPLKTPTLHNINNQNNSDIDILGNHHPGYLQVRLL